MNARTLRPLGFLLVPWLAALATAACSKEPPPPPAARLEAMPPGPRLLFVSVAPDDSFHHAAVASLSSPASGILVTGLTCERVYFNGGRGLCVTTGVDSSHETTWTAAIFDAAFRTTGRVPVRGSPSRVRVSPDGAFAGVTVFESGHSYADHTFSTRTTLIDLQNGAEIADLEQFAATKDGAPFKEKDFNYWGVTFASDNDTFYATLDSGGVSYLVRGSIRSRQVAVVREGVECPSLSPDNTRIAFKKRVGARSAGWWQIAILRLDTLEERVLRQETRSVDDQVDWLDAERLAYHLVSSTTAADLWTLKADDSTPPERLLASAYSPAVMR